MFTKKKSSIKSTDKGGGLRKRLSFAPSPEKKTPSATEEQKNVSRSVPSSTLEVSGNSSCTMTHFGMCYNPKAAPSRVYGHDSIPMKESQRNNFASVLNFPISSKNAADVMIVGEKIIAEKLKMYLLEMHRRQHISQSLKRKINLNITCEQVLTSTMALKIHFMIILFFMDAHESLRDLSTVLKTCSRFTVPSKRIMVVSLSSAQGCFKNVVDQEQFHQLLDSHKVIHLTWKEQGRIEETNTQILLQLIYKSVGWHMGTSLLMDFIMQVDVKDWLVEDIGQDSTGNII